MIRGRKKISLGMGMGLGLGLGLGLGIGLGIGLDQAKNQKHYGWFITNHNVESWLEGLVI